MHTNIYAHTWCWRKILKITSLFKYSMSSCRFLFALQIPAWNATVGIQIQRHKCYTFIRLSATGWVFSTWKIKICLSSDIPSILLNEFVVAFLSIPHSLPRNICIICFSQLKDGLCFLKLLYHQSSPRPGSSFIFLPSESSEAILNLNLSSSLTYIWSLHSAFLSAFSFLCSFSSLCAIYSPSPFFLFLSHPFFHWWKG